MRQVVVAVMAVIVLSHCTAMASDTVTVQYKSPQSASARSTFGTLGPVLLGMVFVAAGGDGENGGSSGAAMGSLLFTGGILVGPGLGHSYAGNNGQFWKGLGFRLAGLGGATVAFALSWNSPDSKTAAFGFGAGMVIMVWSAIHDIATADNSARKFNEAQKQKSLTLAPCFFPEQKAAGLSLSLSF